MSYRQIQPYPFTMGEGDERSINVDYAKWGSPSAAVATLKDLATGQDISADRLTGACQINGTIVATPTIKGPVAGGQYRLKVVVTIAGNLISSYLLINGEL